MVAVEPVDAGVEQVVHHVVELHVPTEGQALEAVVERDEPTAPLGVVQVHHFDAQIGEHGRVAFARTFEVAQRRRVDQLDLGPAAPPLGQGVEVGMAQPEPADRVAPCFFGGRHHRLGDGVVLQIERELEAGPAARRRGRTAPGCGRAGRPGPPRRSAGGGAGPRPPRRGRARRGRRRSARRRSRSRSHRVAGRARRPRSCSRGRVRGSAVGERYRWPSERRKPGRHRFMLAIGPKWVVRPTIMRSRPVALGADPLRSSQRRGRRWQPSGPVAQSAGTSS